jgi:hypothetical protein
MPNYRILGKRTRAERVEEAERAKEAELRLKRMMNYMPVNIDYSNYHRLPKALKIDIPSPIERPQLRRPGEPIVRRTGARARTMAAVEKQKKIAILYHRAQGRKIAKLLRRRLLTPKSERQWDHKPFVTQALKHLYQAELLSDEFTSQRDNFNYEHGTRHDWPPGWNERARRFVKPISPTRVLPKRWDVARVRREYNEIQRKNTYTDRKNKAYFDRIDYEWNTPGFQYAADLALRRAGGV